MGLPFFSTCFQAGRGLVIIIELYDEYNPYRD